MKTIFAAAIALAGLPAIAGAQEVQELDSFNLGMRGNIHDILPSAYVRSAMAFDYITFRFECTAVDVPGSTTGRRRLEGCRVSADPVPAMQLDQAYVADRSSRQFTLREVAAGPVQFTFYCTNESGQELVCGIRA